MARPELRASASTSALGLSSSSSASHSSEPVELAPPDTTTTTAGTTRWAGTSGTPSASLSFPRIARSASANVISGASHSSYTQAEAGGEARDAKATRARRRSSLTQFLGLKRSSGSLKHAAEGPNAKTLPQTPRQKRPSPPQLRQIDRASVFGAEWLVDFGSSFSEAPELPIPQHSSSPEARSPAQSGWSESPRTPRTARALDSPSDASTMRHRRRSSSLASTEYFPSPRRQHQQQQQTGHSHTGAALAAATESGDPSLPPLTSRARRSETFPSPPRRRAGSVRSYTLYGADKRLEDALPVAGPSEPSSSAQPSARPSMPPRQSTLDSIDDLAELVADIMEMPSDDDDDEGEGVVARQRANVPERSSSLHYRDGSGSSRDSLPTRSSSLNVLPPLRGGPPPLPSSHTLPTIATSSASTPRIPRPSRPERAPGSNGSASQHIKTIDEILREHGAALKAPTRTASASAPPASLHVATKAAVSEDETSRSSLDSVAEEVRSTMREHDRGPVCTAEPVDVDTRTPVQRQGSRRALSTSTRRTRRMSDEASEMGSFISRTRSPLPHSPTSIESPSTSAELNAYLRSTRLTRIVRLRRERQRGVNVSFADVGAAGGHPVFVFLGLGCVRYLVALYDEMAEMLGLRLICFDRWGLGKTSEVPEERRGFLEWADVVEEVADELGIARFGLLAHSAGAPYALATALRLAPRIDGAVHLLAPWASVSNDGLAGGYKLLKYMPSGMIRTAQAAELKVQGWRLGKQPGTSMPEAVGYDKRQPSRLTPSPTPSHDAWASTSSLGESSDATGDESASESSHVRLRKKQSMGRTRLNGIFASGGSGKGSSSHPSRSRRSSMQSSMASPTSSLHPPSGSLPSPTAPQPPPKTPRAKSPVNSSPANSSPLAMGMSGADLAVALLRASHAESLKGSTSDLLAILERTSKPWNFRLEDIEAPVRVWHGTKDERISMSSVRTLERTLQRCTVSVVEGADHSMMTNGRVMIEVLESLAAQW